MTIKYRIKSHAKLTGIESHGTGTFDRKTAQDIADGLNKSESGKWCYFTIEAVEVEEEPQP